MTKMYCFIVKNNVEVIFIFMLLYYALLPNIQKLYERKVEEYQEREEAHEVENKWEQIKRAMVRVLKRLTTTGLTSSAGILLMKRGRII